MNGRSSTFGGLLGYTILLIGGVYGAIFIVRDIIKPFICWATSGCVL